jgi:hypothetical protein
MSDNEYVVECIVEHIMHMEYIDMLRDTDPSKADLDMNLLGAVSDAIKENRLLDYK